MGKCKYCGQDAGFLKRVHTTCEEEHNKAIATTQNAIANYFNGSNSIQDVLATLQHTSQHAFASEEDLLKIIQEKENTKVVLQDIGGESCNLEDGKWNCD